MKTKKEALFHGRICKALLGKGWKIEARKNIQWYALLSKGPVSVRIEESGGGDPHRYWCMVSHHPDLPGCGNPEWTPVKHRTFLNPREAVREAIAPVFKVVDRYKRVASSCDRILKGL